MSKSTKDELEEIHRKIKYATERKAYLVEYIEDLAKAGELTSNEIIDRAKELSGLEADLKVELKKLDTLSLIIGYEAQIKKLEKELSEATINDFQNLNR